MGSYMGHEYADAPRGDKAGRYRVGDRVRVVKAEGHDDGGSTHGAKIGDTFTLKEWCFGAWWSTNGPEFYPHELAPAFLKGDRVRLNKHSGSRGCGERGEVRCVLGDNVSVRMDELSCWGGRVSVFPIDVLDWERAPVDAADCAGRREQQAKPKFKAGDVVEYKDGTRGLNTIKCVKTCYADGSPFLHEAAYDYVDNGWDFEHALQLATPCPPWDLKISDKGHVIGFNIPRPCIVALVKNGQPRPSTYPHVHASVAAATTEAERLARINPGQEFAVYQRVTARAAEVQMKEVA